MAYKYDHLVVIANKYGLAGLNAKGELFETYDKLRDLTVGGAAIGGSGFGGASQFLINLAQMMAPSSFMPILGANQTLNIPGTSYYSPAISGGVSMAPLSNSSFGLSELSKHPSFPTGKAAAVVPMAVGALGGSLLYGIGNKLSSLSDGYAIGGVPTGQAAAIVNSNTLAGIAGMGTGAVSTKSKARSILLPTAGVLAGVGSMLATLSPYFGPLGLVGGLAGNILNGYGGATLRAYQQASGRIINNADAILTAKIKNIETTVKQLDVQGNIVRKMLKESIDGDSKAMQSML